MSKGKVCGREGDIGMKKRFVAAVLACMLSVTVFLPSLAFAVESTPQYMSAGESGFHYVHDPMEYPGIEADIVVNPDAIYGYSPNPASDRLGEFASYDWTDPAVVYKAREDRIRYLDQDRVLYQYKLKLEYGGASVEEMARAFSMARNAIRLMSYTGNPVGLEQVKRSNLKTYGNESGPTPEYLYKKYGSWEMVLKKSFSINAGMDACLGLYDDNYHLYYAYGRLTPPETDEEKLGRWGDNTPLRDIYLLNKEIYDNPKYFNQETGEIIWPPNGGYWGEPFELTLVPGMKIDRYGNDYGTYSALYGNPIEMYSCTPDTRYRPYSVFVVKKPFNARAGMTAPWFDQPGGTTQVELPCRVKDLLEEGYLERVEYR